MEHLCHLNWISSSVEIVQYIYLCCHDVAFHDFYGDKSFQEKREKTFCVIKRKWNKVHFNADNKW